MSDIEKKFNNLKAKYIENLSKQLENLKLLLNKTAKDIPYQELEQLKRIVHNLLGTGQTYGYPAISAAAKRIEELLDEQFEFTDALKPLISELIQCIKVACSNNPSFQEKNEALEFHEVKKNLPDVIIADDDPDITHLLKIHLESEANIFIAKDGQEVLKLLSYLQPKLIILNEDMPHINGFELLKLLKNDAEKSSIPVMMLTSKDQPEHIIDTILKGAIDYIIKPFNLDEFVQKIRQLINQLNQKILIADDDSAICDLLKFKFKQAGCQVFIAEDGIEALRLARIEHPNLIILDVMMPGIDGLTLLQQLRQDHHFNQVPILLLTAKRLETDIVKSFQLGATEYITKPFMIKELLARSFRLLNINKDHLNDQ